jgi:hypothetical protein
MEKQQQQQQQHLQHSASSASVHPHPDTHTYTNTYTTSTSHHHLLTPSLCIDPPQPLSPHPDSAFHITLQALPILLLSAPSLQAFPAQLKSVLVPFFPKWNEFSASDADIRLLLSIASFATISTFIEYIHMRMAISIPYSIPNKVPAPYASTLKSGKNQKSGFLQLSPNMSMYIPSSSPSTDPLHSIPGEFPFYIDTQCHISSQTPSTDYYHQETPVLSPSSSTIPHSLPSAYNSPDLNTRNLNLSNVSTASSQIQLSLPPHIAQNSTSTSSTAKDHRNPIVSMLVSLPTPSPPPPGTDNRGAGAGAGVGAADDTDISTDGAGADASTGDESITDAVTDDLNTSTADDLHINITNTTNTIPIDTTITSTPSLPPSIPPTLTSPLALLLRSSSPPDIFMPPLNITAAHTSALKWLRSLAIPPLSRETLSSRLVPFAILLSEYHPPSLSK